METAKPPTSISMPSLLLRLLWVLLCGASISSALPNRELQMLEMMQNILRMDDVDVSDRNQRSVPISFASSVPCEDSLPQDSSDQLNLFQEDFDESEECGDFGGPCYEVPAPTPTPQPCPNPLVPIDHPCYIRVVVLQTPLMRQDPCTNFTLGMQQQTSTTTRRPDPTKPKGKKCNKNTDKQRASLNSAANAPNTTNTTNNSTISPATNATESSETTQETTQDTTLSTTPNTTVETTTEIYSTSSSSTSNTSNTTTVVITTTEPTTTTRKYKSVANRAKSDQRKRDQKNRPRVPDTPQIKYDGVVQSSSISEVVVTDNTRSSTLRPEAFATTTDCIETAEDEETTAKNVDSEANDESEDCESEASEDCEDNEDQNSNLCPQYSVHGNSGNRHRPYPYRQPTGNIPEPIFHEGQIIKPRQRPQQPHRRDFYVSNKQIMPRPRPKPREPLPHSIYMNNIVRGIKCSDEAGGHDHQPPSRHFGGRPTIPVPRHWPGGRRNLPNYGRMEGPPLTAPIQGRGRGNPLYGFGSAEDTDAYRHDSDQYYDDDSSERLGWPREHPTAHTSSAAADPCQAELERGRHRQSEYDRNRDNDHNMDYPQRMPQNYFT